MRRKIETKRFSFSFERRAARAFSNRQVSKGRVAAADRIHAQRQVSSSGRTADAALDEPRSDEQIQSVETFLSIFDQSDFHVETVAENSRTTALKQFEMKTFKKIPFLSHLCCVVE